MARKEINIFGTSFLDLLSGALAAVIILFIIVPKMTSEQQSALEEIERMNVQMEDLNHLMERLQNSVPQDVYEEIQAQMEALRNTADELREQAQQMQERLAAAESENQRLRRELEQRQDVRQQNEQLQRQNEQLQQRISQLEAQLQQQRPSPGQGISDGKVFGMNAELGVVCQWPENVDVDLYVKNLSTGDICYYGAKNQPFGSLMEDITSRTSPDDDRYELLYQNKIIPGSYQIYVNIYYGTNNHWDGTPAHVEGYIVMFPGKPNQIKIPYQPVVLTQGGQNTIIGTLNVTPNQKNLQK